MNLKKIPELVMDDIRARVPIIQGGMSVGISLSSLASAVANAGGIGVIGVAGIGSDEPDLRNDYRGINARALRKEIQKARRMSDGLIGVNIMMALSDYDSMIKTAMEEGVDVIFIGAGLLLRLPDTLDIEDIKSSKTKIVPIVSNAKGAKIMFNYWAKNYDHIPDAVVVEGPKAGGHLGFRKEDLEKEENQLETLVPQVIEEIIPFRERFGKDIPVIAAGGIYTGEDIYRFMEMGASGVQMATRFVATHECDASQKFKDAYINCSEDDITIIKSPVGMPGRAVKNQFLKDVEQGNRKPFNCGWRCLRTCNYKEAPYCIAIALRDAKEGNLGTGFAFAGKNAYRINGLKYVKELIEELVNEYEAIANGKPSLG
jgi:NAD(P)H-dependent flavin oxidoreductase YrpB (nitropropane dioxygenase family)